MVDCAGLGGRRMTSSALPQLKAPAPRDGVLISGAGSQRLGDLDCTLLARFAPHPGLVTLRQTFVRRSHKIAAASLAPFLPRLRAASISRSTRSLSDTPLADSWHWAVGVVFGLLWSRWCRSSADFLSIDGVADRSSVWNCRGKRTLSQLESRHNINASRKSNVIGVRSPMHLAPWASRMGTLRVGGP